MSVMYTYKDRSLTESLDHLIGERSAKLSKDEDYDRW